MSVSLDRNKDPSLVSFGKTIRKLRIDKEISRAQLAQDSQISIPYLGILERGERSPTLTTIVKIAKALGEESILIEII